MCIKKKTCRNKNRFLIPALHEMSNGKTDLKSAWQLLSIWKKTKTSSGWKKQLTLSSTLDISRGTI